MEVVEPATLKKVVTQHAKKIDSLGRRTKNIPVFSFLVPPQNGRVRKPVVWKVSLLSVRGLSFPPFEITFQKV